VPDEILAHISATATTSTSSGVINIDIEAELANSIL
jgi:hypothetical protein